MSEQTQPPRYDIRQVEDFLSVPLERLAVCLEEFKVFLAVSHAHGALLPGAVITQGFVWIDDDKHEARMNFTKDGEVFHREAFDMRGLANDGKEQQA